MARPHMLVIGSTNTDMVMDLPALPVVGQTVLGGRFRLAPGGKGANQAVAAARAGGAVTFITALGDDAFGAESQARFVREGIDTRYLVIRADVPSGVALIMVDAHGENLIAVASGANAQLSPAELTAARPAFHGAPMTLLQLEIPLESVAWAVAEAKARGGTVLLNPAPMPPAGLPDDILRHVDLITPNEGELRALAPDTASLEAAAAQVLARGPRVVIVTRGKHGAIAFSADGAIPFPAFTVKTVDTVGAGDCFSASLAVALAEGQPLPTALRFATAAAALCTTRPGAQDSMPVREDIETFLALH